MIDRSTANELAEKLLSLLSPQAGEGALLVYQRKLLEQIYKELLADVPLVFNGLFARMQYFHDNYGTPAELVRQLNILRVLANKAAHEEIASIPQGAVTSGARSIYSLLKYLCPELENPQLEELVKGAKDFPKPPPSKKHSFHCIIKSWSYYKTGGQKAGLEIFALNEDNEELSILLRDDTKNAGKTPISMLGPSLWPYANLTCLELSEVAGKRNCYVDNPRSLIVLEPDFLVDASAIAECMDAEKSSPELYVLSRLFGESASQRMLLGKLVNNIFDDLFYEPDADYNSLFKRGLATMPIPMVALGKESAMDIYREIESGHYNVLKDFCKNTPDQDILLEPSFLCPTYGLQGRLDLLYRKNKKYSIVELKSGKAHPSGVWPSQMYQVVAYNMIIRNAYGTENMGSSSILYSANEEKPLRNVANMPMLEQNLLHCRNRIVGIMRLLSEDPSRFFHWLRKQNEHNYPSFNAERLDRFKALLAGIRSFEFEWFCEQVKRVVREIWFVKTGAADNEVSYGHNALWRQSNVEKQGKIIRKLEISDYKNREITLRFGEDPGVSDFRQGDIVVLYQEKLRIDKQEILRGVISDFQNEHIVIRARGGLKRELDTGTTWAIEHDVLEGFLYGPLCSLTSFLEAEQSVRDLFFGLRQPVMRDIDPPEDEKEAVISCMNASEELYIVQGPPGTGKTSHLIGNYVERFFKNTAKKILILSFTNRAVDEICLCLRKREIPFIRTGNSQTIHDNLLDNIVEGERFQKIDSLLRANRIYVATVQSACAWFRDLKRLTGIDEILVDEASQILESSILGLLTLAPKAILIGDQNQLPAISVQSELDYKFETEELKELKYDKINQSLMERLYRVYRSRDWEKNLAMLKGHYRMHFQISNLISHYYENLLNPIRKEQFLPLPKSALLEQIDARLLWLECPPASQPYFDPLHIKAIVKLVEEFKRAGLVQNPQKDLGIIAPYRVMIHALSKEIDEVSIDTVERYQGSERDTIILSFPLQNTNGIRSLQALSADGKIDRKLNVALSRAKNRLIVIGNSSICAASAHLAHLYENIRLSGRIIDIHEII
jgi:DNA replication ATP-dependent helicase Dna2